MFYVESMEKIHHFTFYPLFKVGFEYLLKKPPIKNTLKNHTINNNIIINSSTSSPFFYYPLCVYFFVWVCVIPF